MMLSNRGLHHGVQTIDVFLEFFVRVLPRTKWEDDLMNQIVNILEFMC